MYVYLCTGTPNSTHKSTSIKMYRESSVESFECSYLTPKRNNRIAVEKRFSFF
jgi:hypothetical protein